MEQNFPKADEVCRIIAACRKSGVSSLKFGPLEVVFGGHAAEGVLRDSAQAPISGVAPTPATEDAGQIIQAQQQAEQASHEEQEILVREQNYAELVITDPLEAERLMEEGDAEPTGEIDGAEGVETLD